jgi:hypothetical protein
LVSNTTVAPASRALTMVRISLPRARGARIAIEMPEKYTVSAPTTAASSASTSSARSFAADCPRQ